jgi:hypothetical protein
VIAAEVDRQLNKTKSETKEFSSRRKLAEQSKREKDFDLAVTRGALLLLVSRVN